MNKRTLFLTAALSMALAQAQNSSTTTQPATLPAAVRPATTDAQLSNTPITVETGSYSGPLSSLLAAIAKSAGYGLILESDVDTLRTATTTTTPNQNITAPPTNTSTVVQTTQRDTVYSFRNQPFSQVWPFLMEVNGLSYEVVKLGDQPVLRVSNQPIQRVVTLKNANAAEAANQVKLFFGTPTYSETQQRDAQGNVTGVTRTLADVRIDSPTLRIVPDVRNNSVIVRGTNKEVVEVTRLLTELDQTNAPAAATTNTNQTVQHIYTVLGQQADVAALLAAQYSGIKVTPVGQTGQLVLTGPQNQIDAALTLLGQVDRPTPAPMAVNQRVFQLVNASAEEVKATLEGTLAREVTNAPAQAGTGTTLLDVNGNPISALVPPSQQASANAQGLPTTSTTPQATANTGAQAATIIADRRTNTLVVRGTKAQVDQIAELIPQLDKVVPQVNIQVRIQEITDSATRELGLNARASFGGFNVTTAAGGGLKATFDPTQSFYGFNIFPTLNALESQRMSKRVYDGSITMQSGQRSVGNTGQTENASSGAAATVKSGGTLSINIPSQAANIPSIQKDLDYGVILDFINPQIASDGTVTVRVRGKVNTILSNISPNAIPYVIDQSNSEAQSVVTFKSGETLLLSGLMGKTSTADNSGLPFLSKFGVGGNTSKSETFSQLLVIITGTVVK